MDFLGPNDILVTEKDNGTVRRILDGEILKVPVLDTNVANKFDRGLLGLAISKDEAESADHSTIYVYIYLTESKIEGTDHCTSWRSCSEGGEPEGNRIYRYRWDGQKLTEPKLLLNLPALPGPAHNGGALMIGPDKNLYLVMGDLRLPNKISQNVKDGFPADGSSGILRITQAGNPVGEGILGKKYPLNLYYAYGIRNSFGMDFDPVTGILWDTENGYLFGDEINLVKPGFNSGWAKVQGIWRIENLDEYGVDTTNQGQVTTRPHGLINFGGKGEYSNPELIWNKTVGLTSLRFVNSDKLGMDYKNDILVGDYYGNVYHFELNDDRKSFSGREKITDRIVNMSSTQNIIAKGFHAVTDIKIGPDGFPYFLSFYNGTIYRMLPNQIE
jgi:glucose/arabinose dehydrogenase